MKKLILFVIVSVNLLGFERNFTTFNYNLSPKKVSYNVWCFFGALEPPTKSNGGNMVNSCYIKAKNSFIIFDSGPSYQYAKQSYAAMSKIANLPVKTVIVGHEHDDHWLGNSFYKDKFGAKLIGIKVIDDKYKDFSQTRMSKILTKNATKNTKVVKLDEYIDKTKTMIIDGEVLELNYLEYKAHTTNDMFLYMPKRKVLFASDLVMNGRITSNRHGSLTGQIKAINLIESKDYDTLIVGHGFLTDKTAIDEAKQYFTSMKRQIKKALDEGVEASDILNIVKMEQFKDKAMFKLLNPINVTRGFDEIEFEE